MTIIQVILIISVYPRPHEWISRLVLERLSISPMAIKSKKKKPVSYKTNLSDYKACVTEILKL